MRYGLLVWLFLLLLSSPASAQIFRRFSRSYSQSVRQPVRQPVNTGKMPKAIEKSAVPGQKAAAKPETVKPATPLPAKAASSKPAELIAP